MLKQLSSRLASIALALLLLVSSASAALNFTVSNQTSLPLGEVTLHYSTGSTAVNVLTTGNYVKEVATDIVAVTINGQTVSKPFVGTLTLTGGDTVIVGWSDARVTVIDPTENL
jgi:hypothetical protein